MIRTTADATATHPAPARRRRAALGALALVGLLAFVFASCVIEEIREQYAVEVVVEGQVWNEQSLGAVDDALSRLPDHVVRRLGSRHYGRLNILSNADGVTLEGWQPYANGANFYSNHDDRNQLVLVPGQYLFTVLHELGHAYQMRQVPSDQYAWVFFQTEMREFMSAADWRLESSDADVAAARSVAELSFANDGPTVWDALSNFDPVEDYANSFALYFSDPDELLERSPARYEFMRDHVASDAR